MNECTYSAFWNQLINSDLLELRMSRTKFRDDYLYSFQLPSFSNKFEHGTKKMCYFLLPNISKIKTVYDVKLGTRCKNNQKKALLLASNINLQ